MTKRGRKPKPTAAKIAAGNPGRRPLPQNEPQVEPALMDPPEHLGEIAKAEWQRVSPLLFSTGIVTELDRAVLTGYCDAWATYVKMSVLVAKYGEVMLSKKENAMPYPSPYYNLKLSGLNQMRAFATELGMSPSSRSSVTAVRPRVDEPQGKGRFFVVGEDGMRTSSVG